jgi:hypothetical protein
MYVMIMFCVMYVMIMLCVMIGRATWALKTLRRVKVHYCFTKMRCFAAKHVVFRSCWFLLTLVVRAAYKVTEPVKLSNVKPVVYLGIM